MVENYVNIVSSYMNFFVSVVIISLLSVSFEFMLYGSVILTMAKDKISLFVLL